MRPLPLALLLVALASPAVAQSIPVPSGPTAFVVPQSPIDISYITLGADYDLRPIEADPARPGRELLVYLPSLWVFSAGRWHPEKHGVGGTLAGPGICLEAWTPITIAGPVWHYNTDGDVTGDGLDDFVIYRQDGTADLYVGRGLSVCR